MEIGNLDREQTHMALRFLLHRMDQKTRLAFMAELPVAYSRLFPNVAPATILDKVEQAVAR